MLPQNYREEEYYPVAFDVACEDQLSPDLKRFEGRTLVVRNKGRECAEACGVKAWLLTTSISLPVQAYWVDEGGQDFTYIPPREVQHLVPFLVDREKKEIIFCTAFAPEYTGNPRWQFSLPIRSSFTLSIKIKSPSAATLHKEFDFKGTGPGIANIRLIRVRKITNDQ